MDGGRSRVPRPKQYGRVITLGVDGEKSSFALNSGNINNRREVESGSSSQRNRNVTRRMRVTEAQGAEHFQEGVLKGAHSRT